MTTVVNDRRYEYPGNAVATVFQGPKAFSASHIFVYLVVDATQVATLQTSGYTLTGVGGNSTTITMAVAPPTGQTLLILRTVPYSQDADITNQGAYLPEFIENALDALDQQTQQLADGISRSLRVADTAVGVSAIATVTPNRYVVTSVSGFGLTDVPPLADFTLRTDLANATVLTGAALIGLLLSGTGAASRTVQQRLSETIHATDYGVIGDGVTNNSAVIVNAKATGKTVVLPASTAGYKFTTTVATTANAWSIDPTLSWAKWSDSGKLNILRGHFTGAGNGANIWRFADRVFIGDAANGWSAAAAGVPDAGNSWFSSNSITGGPAFLGVHASLLVTSPDTGDSAARYGIVGAAKLSANTTSAVGAIGVAGAVIANKAGSNSAWALYGDATAVQGTGLWGLELAVKNATGVNYTGNVYAGNPAGGVGIQLSGGGDNAYGPVSTNPSNTGIVFVRNTQTWNKGICFNSASMTVDGGGIATCIEMPTNYSMTWLTNDGSFLPAARIYSTVTANGNRSIQVFENDSVSWYNNAGARTFQAGGTATSVNYLKATGAVAGSAPSFAFTGSDTDVSGVYTTKGVGAHSFYSHASSALQFSISATVGANDAIVVAGGINGSSDPTIQPIGSTNIGITIASKAAGNITLDPKTGDIKWGKAKVALGGGAAPTFGTIGGTGPATAAQNAWLRVLDSTGAAKWVPCWA